MKRIFKIVGVALAMACAASANATIPNLLQGTDGEQCRKWVDSVFNTMSETDRLKQLFMPVVDPTNIAVAKKTLYNHIVNNSVGGILFSGGKARQYTELIDYCQSVAKVPLLFTLDGEWGPAMRLKDVDGFPYNMGLGAIQDPELLYLYGQETARQCRLLGLQVNFAPVLDVNSDPANPVIGKRSFGEDPRRVAELGCAYSRGLESGGVMAVAKHFPGHGDTNVDSHKVLPTIYHDKCTLDSVDLLPFQRFIDEGYSGIMVGHLNVPVVDKTNTPSSLSKFVSTDLLKHEMGFEGLAFTDALTMGGASQKNSDNCLRAFKAGADVLLKPANTAASIQAMLAALRSGEITQSQIDESCRKILTYKYVLGLRKRPEKVDRPDLLEQLNSPEAEAVRRNLVEAMTTCIRNDNDLLPFKNLESNTIAVVNIGAPAANEFTRFCGKYADVSTFAAQQGLTQQQLMRIKKHSIVVAAVYSDNEGARHIMSQLSRCENLVTVFFINPYKMSDFAPIPGEAILLMGENTRLTREYAAQALFGGIEVRGKLPVNVKGVAPSGRGILLPKTRIGYSDPLSAGFKLPLADSIDKIIKTAMTAGAFPGCQILVARNGNVILDRQYGFTDRSRVVAVTDSTLYDLASVSKITGTLPGVMAAYDKGLFGLDKPASAYIPEMSTEGKDTITVRQLLLHQSRMPASISMYDLMMDPCTYTGRLLSRRKRVPNTVLVHRGVYGNADAKLRKDIISAHKSESAPYSVAGNVYVGQAAMDTIMQHVYDVPLRNKHGYLYSDLNFALLMDMEQNVTGEPHDKWVRDNVFGPLGCTRTGYRPLGRFKKRNIAPTENDRFLRKCTGHGIVHDEFAAFSGGVQGNAGLFSNSGDLAKLCQMWLNGGVYGGQRLLKKETVDLFTKTKSDISRRGLGFDKPDVDNPDKSPTAKSAPASVYGHLGFTGTAVWVDPDNDMFMIFLCNRVCPTRDNRAFSTTNPRPALMQAIYNCM
ncbi:glycoside hydrolase family 3 N-terminal domain-containing protein [uncultured Muribaculum sp.]|uniref:glycoside hydrolase family 3 N-terminal domain-containing protein n=2 Tax=uncultured Muribaculum sp. TaxID=1918613 RepID=UPI0025B23701|nr:glycoside hydrolase family 3 N-terminal domain-containing protein [uncultured Muribaculum sp.]